MANWTESMQQSFKYFTVDPGTWEDMEELKEVKSCTITRDSDLETLGSATIDITNMLGECYVRTYLVTNQNGVEEQHPLGTHIVQTPKSSFDGKKKDVSMDAYTPLLELKEKQPPLGYSLLKGDNILDNAFKITRENLRAPVVKTDCSETLYRDFVADTSEHWLSFNTDLLANAKYEYGLDEMGRVLFLPKQDTASLQPVWTYNDDNSSILLPDVDISHDLYDIPNVVEVIYSTTSESYYAKAVNDDPNSPTSTISRGREIPYRVTNPDSLGNPTQNQIDEYAEQLLRELSTLEYTVTYSHGYCPVRLGDCVRLNYTRADLKDVKAKVIYQSIKCDTGCEVKEKAVFTKKLWG